MVNSFVIHPNAFSKPLHLDAVSFVHNEGPIIGDRVILTEDLYVFLTAIAYLKVDTGINAALFVEFGVISRIDTLLCHPNIILKGHIHFVGT